MLFLQELVAFDSGTQVTDIYGLGALWGLLAAFFILWMIVAIGLYIYTSLAFMAIARRANYSSPGIAWIPGIGPLIIANKISGMHWWPWLLLIGFLIPFVNFIAIIVFAVFTIIWTWKMFEAIGRPGWWAIMPIIPLIGGILYLVFIGMAAWGNPRQ